MCVDDNARLIDFGYTTPTFVVINYYIFAHSFERMYDGYISSWRLFRVPRSFKSDNFSSLRSLNILTFSSAGDLVAIHRVILYFKMILNFPLNEPSPSRKVQLILLQQNFSGRRLLIVFLFFATYLNSY